MPRDEIKKLFPETIDEQVSALLSSHHSEMNKLRYDNKAKAENQRLLNRTKAAAKLSAAGLSEEEYSAVPDGFVRDNKEQTIGFAEALTKPISTSREKAADAVTNSAQQGTKV